MTLDHVQAGTPARLSARDWNDICDAVKWVKQYKQLVDGGSTPRVNVNDCRVRCQSGVALRAGDPIKASSLSFAGSRTRMVAGTTASSSSSWGVCLSPVAANGWVDVAFTGTVPCYVTISDESHTCVTIDGGTGLCISATSGDAEIIAKPSGTPTDERLCIVRLGNRQASTARQRLHSYTTGWSGTIPNGGDVNVPMWDADTIIQSSPGIFDFNGTDFDRLKSLVTGMMIATASVDVEYASSGSSTDGVLIGSFWESTGSWFTGMDTYGLTQSYIRYSKGCVTNTTMFQVAVDQEIWFRLSTATGLGYFWGTTSDMTVNNVRVSLVHVTDDFLTP